MGGKTTSPSESAPRATEKAERKIRLRHPPARSAKAAANSAERQRRLAAALRANLRKRKAQLAARGADSASALSAAPSPRAKRG